MSLSITKTNCVIQWIEIYPLDSTIHPLNNIPRGQFVSDHVVQAKQFPPVRLGNVTEVNRPRPGKTPYRDWAGTSIVTAKKAKEVRRLT